MNKLSFAAFVASVTLAASTLLTATKAADLDPQTTLAPIMNKMCSGTVGRETPIRLFFRPTLGGNGGVVMETW